MVGMQGREKNHLSECPVHRYFVEIGKKTMGFFPNEDPVHDTTTSFLNKKPRSNMSKAYIINRDPVDRSFPCGPSAGRRGCHLDMCSIARGLLTRPLQSFRHQSLECCLSESYIQCNVFGITHALVRGGLRPHHHPPPTETGPPASFSMSCRVIAYSFDRSIDMPCALVPKSMSKTLRSGMAACWRPPQQPMHAKNSCLEIRHLAHPISQPMRAHKRSPPAVRVTVRFINKTLWAELEAVTGRHGMVWHAPDTDDVPRCIK